MIFNSHPFLPSRKIPNQGLYGQLNKRRGEMPLFKMDSWFIPWKGAENAGAELAKMTVLLF